MDYHPPPFHETSIVVCCFPPCWHFSNTRFGFGELLDDFKGHMFFCDLSLNLKASSLNVEGCCGSTNIDMINTYGFFFRKKCYINTSMINVEWQTFFLMSNFPIPCKTLDCVVVHLTNYLNCLNILFV